MGIVAVGVEDRHEQRSKRRKWRGVGGEVGQGGKEERKRMSRGGTTYE